MYTSSDGRPQSRGENHYSYRGFKTRAYSRVSKQVVLVDDWQTLQYAERALTAPPKVGGRGGTEGVSCVGLDVEMTPATSKASLLQVRVFVIRHPLRSLGAHLLFL